MLVDAGGSRTRGAHDGASQGRRWDPGEDIVSPYLWSRGIKKIDVVVLSHAHEDYRGGLGAILENFHVGEFWHAQNPETSAALLEKILKRGIPMRTLYAGDTISRGGASIEVWWPARQRPLARTPANDNSLVMRISAGGICFLLPGDAGRNMERQLLRSGAPLDSQVLKVAHHGSKSSSSPEFIARVAPRVAIISAEAGGGRNLPNPETLELLRNAGVRVLRTDIDGATTVDWSEGALVVRSYSSSGVAVRSGGGAR